MLRKIIFCTFLIFFVGNLNAQKKVAAVPVVFDSDMGPDYDDVGAITLLHAFADSGYINILATVASTKYEGVAAVFNVFNTYFNCPDLIIGVPKGKALELKDGQHWTDTLLLKYPHKIKTNDEVPDAVKVYRKVLSAQPDNSVTIITVGFLTNLAGLLRSPSDEYSPLNGKELVKQKVKKLVCMAGGFPSGKEFNIKMDAASSQYVYDNWQTPVYFSGFEIGWRIRTGLPLIGNEAIKNSPVQDVFRICIPLSKEDSAGRMSWDETAVLLAVKGYKPWWKLKEGRIKITDDGSNTWTEKPKGQYYLVEAAPIPVVQQFINELIMHQPIQRNR